MGVICNGGFSGALVLGFVYGLGLDMERSWGSAFCRRCVFACVCVCVFFFFLFVFFFRRLVVRRPGRFQCPMYMILDREGGFVVVCVSLSSLFQCSGAFGPGWLASPTADADTSRVGEKFYMLYG